MEEIKESMDDFKEDIDKSLKRLYVGDIVEGKIVTQLEDELIIDIGFHADGVVPADEISEDPNFNKEELAIGDTITAKVLKLEDGEGHVLLSRKRAEKETAWETLTTYLEEKKHLKVNVAEIVKGGALAYVNGLRGFIPASLIGTHYVEDLTIYLHQELEVQVIELDEKTNRIILSAKEIALQKEKELKQERLQALEKGMVLEGQVVHLTNFGAFVDIGGIQGLVRNNDLAWKRVKHPKEVVQVGDQVKVYILDIDRKTEKIALGLKDVKEDPWNQVVDTYQVGKISEGKVVKLMDFGAFIQLAEGVEGLVHISEIADERITKPGDVLTIGDVVKVKIIQIDNNQRKIGLSIKEAKYDEDKEMLQDYSDEDQATTSLKDVFGSILDKLNN